MGQRMRGVTAPIYMNKDFCLSPYNESDKKGNVERGQKGWKLMYNNKGLCLSHLPDRLEKYARLEIFNEINSF